MLDKVTLGGFAAVANLLVADVEPVPRFGDESHLLTDIKDFAIFGDTFAIDHFDGAGFEWRGDFVLNDLHLAGVADDVRAVFDGFGPTDIDADGSIELKGASTGRGFWIPIDDPNFFTDLVDEDDDGACAIKNAGDFAHALAHQAGLQSDLVIAHHAI